MATTQQVTISDEQETALNRALSVVNTQIDARNRRIQAEKDLQTSLGNVYSGPEPEPLKTFEQLVQERFNERVAVDVTDQARVISNDLAATFMKADPATQAAMMSDLAKYRRP